MSIAGSAAEVNFFDKHVPDIETTLSPGGTLLKASWGILTRPSCDMDCSKSDEHDVFEN